MALEVQRGGMPAPARGAAGGGELVGALLERVNRLEEELRGMRGRLDELDYRNRALGQQLEKLQGDLDYRMQQLEGGGRGPRAAHSMGRWPSPDCVAEMGRWANAVVVARM